MKTKGLIAVGLFWGILGSFLTALAFWPWVVIYGGFLLLAGGTVGTLSYMIYQLATEEDFP